jgi:hypothetical protein
MATPAPFVGGGNPSGANTPGASGGGSAVGSVPNPLIPSYPTGTAMPDMSNSVMKGAVADPFPANTAGTIPTSLGAPTNSVNGPAAALGFQGGNLDSITQAFKGAGFSQGIASLLTTFLSSGAGFNPQIAQALINALQPQISRGTAQIQEQFGAEGLGSSSPAAIGMGDFLSQVNLNEGQIFAQEQEQAIQNYMNVLLAGKQQPKQPSGAGALLGGIGSLASSIPGLAGVFGGGGGSSSLSDLFGALGGGTGAAPVASSVIPDLIPLVA